MIAIGEASRQSGVGIEAIRYYEREGIVPKPGRAANNRRLYSKTDVGRLIFLKRCRNLGFPLAEAKALLDLSEQREADCAKALDIAASHKSSIRKKINDLERLERALNEVTANCTNGSLHCPMLLSLREH
ncbi:MAG: MerR family DNA-binding protein [Rhodobacteraceae bacterium]|nr:MerR family DNA-binding protein [Paracoccaceae bacterium]